MFKFVSRKEGKNLKDAFDVSSHGEKPFSLFSPFSTEFKIPHPCNPNITCPSVEALWQGSKVMVIDKKHDIAPDYAMLTGKEPWKKGMKPLGVWIGGKRMTDDVGIGRRVVYVPAYYYFARKVIKKHKLITHLNIMAESDEAFYLYDFDTNGNLDNPAPISHASILVPLLNSLPNLGGKI